ncbi:MAG: hypothetical protein J6N52_07765 [Clostridia bacterium]|nr:hypothetical protein [Clostridia bacterium]
MTEKLKRILSFLISAAVLLSGAYTYAQRQFITDFDEPQDKTVEIEAESFSGTGFSAVDDPEASGGKCLVSSGAGSGVMQYKLTFDQNVEKVVLYAVHKSDNISHCLSYLSVGEYDNYDLYDYKYGVWNKTRIYLGEITSGEYTINLKNVRGGQKIDKLIVKYNTVKEKKEEAKENNDSAETDLTGFKRADAEREKLKVTAMEERVPGSFFAEAENGTFEKSAGTVSSNGDASGGAVWVSTAASRLNDPLLMDGAELRFKFCVPKSCEYALHLRYLTPDSDRKAIWVAIDDEDYYRTEDGNASDRFKWKKVKTYKLEAGWHTLDIKHRTAGQLLDCFILTDDTGFSPMGYGALPGEKPNIDDITRAYIADKRTKPTLRANNFRMRSDGEFKHSGSDIILPATNLATALGAELEDNLDGSYVIRRDREYLKLYVNSNRIISNGKVINTKEKQFIYGDDIPSVSLLAAQETFGFDYELDETENTLHIFDFYEEPYIRPAEEGEITIGTGRKFIYYDIPHDNPDAKVEVWLKERTSDSAGLRKMNFDNLNTIASGGYEYYQPDRINSPGIWQRAQTPVYSDGAFRGAQYSWTDRRFDVKVRITENGIEDTFIATAPEFTGGGDTYQPTPREYTYDTEGELLLVPTFENMSYYIDCDAENPTCEVLYRKQGDDKWQEVFAPSYDFEAKQFRGSIPFLQQDTKYEVKVKVTAGGAVVAEKTAEASTWQDNPPVAQTIKLSDVYKGKGDLVLTRLKGDEDGWIKLDCEGQTIDAGKATEAAVVITDCKNLIFENAVVRGGSAMGITVDARSENIRVVNCDIAQWGEGSIQDPIFGLFIRAGENWNKRAGVAAMDSVNFVVERCYIHDSDSNTNPWYSVSGTYSGVHPAGSCAVLMYGVRGTVIRYNDIIGSDEHRWNDGLEGEDNGGRRAGSCGSDSDIYGNIIIYANDDTMELDGAQMNVRVYQNRLEQAYTGMSTAPNTMGPSYIYRNLIENLGAEDSDTTLIYGPSIKAGGVSDPFPVSFFFNNTVAWRRGIQNANFGGVTAHHAIMRNNIFDAAIPGGVSIENAYANERDSYDYDLYSGTFNVAIPDQEKHGIQGSPTFVDTAKADYRLTGDSKGVGAGMPLGGFTDGDKVNIGAFANDKYDPLFLPARPVDMYADRYRINMIDGESAEVKIHFGDIGEGRTYSLMKNRDFDWLEFDGGVTEDIPIKPNSDVTVKIKTNLSVSCRKYGCGKGAFLVRLDNGYSIPVTVMCSPRQKAQN